MQTLKIIHSPLPSALGNLQSYYPGMSILCPESDLSADSHVWFDHEWRLSRHDEIDTDTNSAIDASVVNRDTKERKVAHVFRKVTHLLDPVRWMQGKYNRPETFSIPLKKEEWDETAWSKLQDPMNQAYVESMAACALSRLRENDISPHFHHFYGSFLRLSAAYTYSISDMFMSFRHKRWYWEAKDSGVFVLKTEDVLSPEMFDIVNTKPDDIEEDTMSTLSTLSFHRSENGELASMHSADSDEIQSIQTNSDENKSESGTDNEDEDEDDEEDLDIFAVIKNFPVISIYMEASQGTMDELLDNVVEVGATHGTAEWESIWSAWIFQVVAALSVAQSIFSFTHNDLHSNNIVWSKTEKEFLYYKTIKGQIYKVPTFGKIFKIIDFGRAVLDLNKKTFFSDDFRKGNDAAEQYYFGELAKEGLPEIKPNPSFDLCRFTVSILEGIFPIVPDDKKGGSLLSTEPDLDVVETISDLFNMLWSWLVCDNGQNVLLDGEGNEKFPDFDLYKVIAAEVHDAVPSKQIAKPPFIQFRLKKKTKVPADEKVYNLFC